MKSLWSDKEAQKYIDDPLGMRVYTSRLIGASKELVLHGGGNTSVKIGDTLYVKGSGWDLSSIQKEGFSGVSLDTLKDMAKRESLSDIEMVKEQREAMVDKSAPTPSIEAILHAIIPFKYVDHTHADSVVTVTNRPNAKRKLKELYGENILIIDYVMPGFLLAKRVYQESKNIDWNSLDGIILLNHGVFTFDNDAKRSYEKMIDIVSKSEESLEVEDVALESFLDDELMYHAKMVSDLRGKAVNAKVLDKKEAYYFSTLSDIESIVDSGPLTPEHVIRTKPFPLIVNGDFSQDLKSFTKKYSDYFKRYSNEEIMLDLAPRYAIFKDRGVLVFAEDEKEEIILKDIVLHTIRAMLKAQKHGGWRSLSQKDIFDMEYWELEQAKLKSDKSSSA